MESYWGMYKTISEKRDHAFEQKQGRVYIRFEEHNRKGESCNFIIISNIKEKCKEGDVL